MPSKNYREELKKAEREREEYAESLAFARDSLYAKVKEFSIIRRTGDSLRAGLSLRQICENIVSIIIDETNAENCSLWLVDHDAAQVRLKAVRGQLDDEPKYFDELESSGIVLPLGIGIAGKVAASGEPMLIENINHSLDFVTIEPAHMTPIGSILCLPIANERQVMGVLNLSHPNAGMFTEESNRVFNLIANQTSLSLSNYSAFEELVKSNEELEKSNSRLRVEIKERKKAQEGLKLAAMVIENVEEGIIVTDADGVMEAVNPAFTQITGYTAEEVIGEKPGILKSTQHNRKFYADMWRSLKRHGKWKGDIWNRKKNGEAYLQRTAITAIRNQSGNTVQYASIFTDITVAKKTEEEIKHLAYHDTLTGLPNRQTFLNNLKRRISLAKRANQIFAILFLDIDNFKHINDTLGHAAGDFILSEMAVRLVGCVREEDIVSRLGGDEFTITLGSIDHLQEAAHVAQRILAAGAAPFRYRKMDLRMSMSIGIATYPDSGADPQELLKNADAAMYHVKDIGKNNFHYFTEAIHEKTARRLDLENRLREAVEKDEFIVYYQPKMSLKTGAIVGMEALVRWQTNDRGMIQPGDFVDLAEETGLIIPIGEKVLRRACELMKKLASNGAGSLCVSVNISARQLDQNTLPALVGRILDETGLDAKMLCLEITESAVMRDPDSAISTLKELKRMNVQISMDDFGSGYSSLGQLKKFSVDELKIDQSFVGEVPDNPEDSEIVKAIVSMAYSLNLKVTAEGVETYEQAEFLNSIGCHDAQGFYISPPLNTGDFRSFIRENGFT